MGPLANKYQAVIADDIKMDTRKLYPLEEFSRGVAGESLEPEGRGPRGGISLKGFVDQRREYLLAIPAIHQASLPGKNP
jgi:hypothetical protein